MLFQYVAGRYEISAFPESRVPQRFLTVMGKADEPGILRRVEMLLRSAEI